MQPGFARWKSAISGWSKKTVSYANATKQLLVGQWTRGSIWHAEAKLPRVFVIGHACAGEWCSGHGIGAHSAAHTVTLDTLFQTASGLQGNTVQPTPPLPSHAHPLHHHPIPFATRCAPPHQHTWVTQCPHAVEDTREGKEEKDAKADGEEELEDEEQKLDRVSRDKKGRVWGWTTGRAGLQAMEREWDGNRVRDGRWDGGGNARNRR